jgi:hypothetical protein
MLVLSLVDFKYGKNGRGRKPKRALRQVHINALPVEPVPMNNKRHPWYQRLPSAIAKCRALFCTSKLPVVVKPSFRDEVKRLRVRLRVVRNGPGHFEFWFQRNCLKDKTYQLFQVTMVPDSKFSIEDRKSQ